MPDNASTVEGSRAPAVSVIMNCYNGEKYLREAIESVLQQRYTDWEIVFWDNHSTDKSAEIFNEYEDNRLRYFYSPEHTSLGAGRKLACEKCRGRFIAFLDVDDTWNEDKLEKQVSLFEDEKVGFVCSNYTIKDEVTGKTRKAISKDMPSGYVLDELLQNYFIALLTLVVRKSALEDIGLINSDYHMIYDFDLAVRLSVRWKLAVIQESLGTYRMHGANESSINFDLNLRELEAWKNEMVKRKAEIGNSRSIFAIDHMIARTKAVGYIFQGERGKAIGMIRSLPFGLDKLRIVAAAILPLGLVSWLSNK